MEKSLTISGFFMDASLGSKSTTMLMATDTDSLECLTTTGTVSITFGSVMLRVGCNEKKSCTATGSFQMLSTDTPMECITKARVQWTLASADFRLIWKAS
jgi:hypothetical protein